MKLLQKINDKLDKVSKSLGEDEEIEITPFSRITLIGIIQCVFLGLKLGKVISWNWFWVLSPIILKALLDIVLIIILMLIPEDRL